MCLFTFQLKKLEVIETTPCSPHFSYTCMINKLKNKFFYNMAAKKKWDKVYTCLPKIGEKSMSNCQNGQKWKLERCEKWGFMLNSVLNRRMKSDTTLLIQRVLFRPHFWPIRPLLTSDLARQPKTNLLFSREIEI